MFSLGDQGEPSSNKQTAVDANKASNAFFPTVKAVYDWAVGLFVTGAASSTDNAIARFDGTTGKLVQNSSVTITDTGDVGIGKTSPTFPLDVNGIIASNLDGGEIRSYQTKDAYYISLKTDSTANRSGIYRNNAGFFNFFDTLTGDVGLDAQYVTGNLVFQTGSVEKMRVSNAGDVGINTDSPTAKLDVNGTSRFRGNATFNGQIIDNVGSSGSDGQVLKKVGGQVIWSNP